MQNTNCRTISLRVNYSLSRRTTQRVARRKTAPLADARSDKKCCGTHVLRFIQTFIPLSNTISLASSVNCWMKLAVKRVVCLVGAC